LEPQEETSEVFVVRMLEEEKMMHFVEETLGLVVVLVLAAVLAAVLVLTLVVVVVPALVLALVLEQDRKDRY
jgi:Flp pilus assembly protein TadB